jgi:hypothetical protein
VIKHKDKIQDHQHDAIKHIPDPTPTQLD